MACILYVLLLLPETLTVESKQQVRLRLARPRKVSVMAVTPLAATQCSWPTALVVEASEKFALGMRGQAWRLHLLILLACDGTHILQQQL